MVPARCYVFQFANVTWIVICARTDNFLGCAVGMVLVFCELIIASRLGYCAGIEAALERLGKAMDAKKPPDP